MVSLVESWESLEEYAKWCRTGAYQLRETVDGIELRVIVGKYGFIKCFRDTGDPLFSHILEFLKTEGYIKVSGNVPDELFFAPSP
ncbi:MAG: hypothetical protein QXR42_05500 [Candidatus Bathyarchaeia archaeon]